MSVLEQKPDYARARPSTIIKNNADYERIFSLKIPIDLFYKLVSIQQKVEAALKQFDDPKLTRNQIGDIKFHVMLYVVVKLTNKLQPKANEIAEINLDDVTEEIIKEAIENTFIIYDAMGGDNGVAKGREFVQEVLELLNENLTKTR